VSRGGGVTMSDGDSVRLLRNGFAALCDGMLCQAILNATTTTKRNATNHLHHQTKTETLIHETVH